ncbi:OmpA family protein [Confluentibacter flavum]|uniref:Flagellar motor protein MotB n=1 Tax=Confluentibacter flavum TaxID=1909700 RepID=A0A2N3HKY1_9FLAO|nr:OmpA family protein [Confluentibacter flavum]PKQ45508.1 flagellar motor protein MotB [Confluentibacter flavum]
MKLKNYILICLVLIISMHSFAQSGLQKKADNLYNKFSFYNAIEVYEELINKNYNSDYNTRQLADCYAYQRNPEIAVIYYKKVVEQPNVPIEYYYKYSEALRGVKDYDESRIWMKKFKDAGGILNDKKLSEDADFITSVFNAKQQYFFSEVKFNSKQSDFGAYERDGNVYFASSADEGVSTKHVYGWNNQPFLDVYVTAKDSDTIIHHKSKIKGKINSNYHDGPLTISKDGKTMYFSRTNFIGNELKKDINGLSNLKIYKATLIDDSWENIEELSINNDTYSVGHPALNSDGSKLYFASDMPGGFGGTDIYYADINADGSLGTPKNLGNTVNTNKNEVFPFVNNENVLFFSSDGHLGLGLLDIFATVSDKDNAIASVLNLGVPVNSNKDDFSFFMNEDGLTGYIASNRDGGVGDDDIYAYYKLPELKVEGTVTDSSTGNPVANATVSLLDANSNELAKVTTDENGHYDIYIDRDADYYLKVNNDNYMDITIPVTSKGIGDNVTSITKDITLNPIEKELPIKELNTIYFDFDKYDINKDSSIELDKIVDMMMNQYPTMSIKIESHTDSRGPEPYNNKLSQERAKSTYDYLISKGVEASRIIEFKGYGELKLTNNCDGTVACSEAQHQLNRRTQFIVIQNK